MGRKHNSGNLSSYMKEKVLADYVELGSMKKVADKLGISESTVYKVIKSSQDDFNEVREEMKKKMVQKVWGHLDDAMQLGHKMIKEALEGEREIPLNHVSNYFGTMYDKQALMAGENTQNIGGDGIQVVLTMPDVEDEEQWGIKQNPSE
jgi:predicted DNA-binding protein YlxM (UPF0122 family)